MGYKLIIEGNAVYEIDEECYRKKYGQYDDLTAQMQNEEDLDIKSATPHSDTNEK